MILPKWLDDQLVGGSNVGCLSKPSPLQVGLQVPRGIRAQTTAESDLWEYPPATGPSFPRAGEAEGMPDRGGTPDAGPRAYVHRDSAEASSRLGDRFLERKERDCHRTAFRKGEELLRRTLLGSRLRGVHRRVRTGAGAPIHPRAGCRGWQRTVLKLEIKARNARRLDPRPD